MCGGATFGGAAAAAWLCVGTRRQQQLLLQAADAQLAARLAVVAFAHVLQCDTLSAREGSCEMVFACCGNGLCVMLLPCRCTCYFRVCS